MNRVNLLRRCSLIKRSWLHHQFNYGSISLLSLGSVFVASPAWSLPAEVSQLAIDRLDKTRQDYQNSNDVEVDAEVEEQEIEIGREAVEHKWQRLTLKAQTSESKTSQVSTADSPLPLDLDPKLIERSPVLQRWLKQVPNVLSDIKRDPSFRTRLRLGYLRFPSTSHAAGLQLGIEDVFAGRSGLTLSADYQTAFNGKREAWGLDWRYYIRPLGSAINLAPVLGYRHLETTRYSTDGVHVGLRLLLVPSRTGAADFAITQSWVDPGSENEVGLTTLSFGYALTHNLRLSTDIQKQNSRFRSDSRVGIGLEWMF